MEVRYRLDRRLTALRSMAPPARGSGLPAGRLGNQSGDLYGMKPQRDMT